MLILTRFFFSLVIFYFGAIDAKANWQSKLKFSNLQANNCPKLALLLYEQESTEEANNFSRQITQTINLIKSILITIERDDCVHIILVTNKKIHFKTIRKVVFSWSTFYTDSLLMEYVQLKYPKSRRWMTNFYRPGSTFGIFLPDILPYDSVIYMDTDMLFLRSIRDLWSEMSNFSSSVLASALVRHIPVSSIQIPVLRRTGLAAGVMHMNLTRMRESKWTQNVITKSMPFLHNITAGFEDFLNIYFYNFPEEVHLLSCDWNYWYQRCEEPCANEDEGIKGGVSILHGNFCTFFNGDREPLYRSIYEAFDNTNLTSNFKLQDLTQQLMTRMEYQRVLHPESQCAKYPTFDELVIKRLRRKLEL